MMRYMHTLKDRTYYSIVSGLLFTDRLDSCTYEPYKEDGHGIRLHVLIMIKLKVASIIKDEAERILKSKRRMKNK